MSRTLRIATRESALALWQAEFIRDGLLHAVAGIDVELLGMTTKGDRFLEAPLSKIGGKGLFVKELEQAMYEGRADLAVHSMKDVPMELPEDMRLSIICQREEPRDAFVSNKVKQLSDLPEGAVVGTSSLRRQCQIKALRPDLEIRSLRGNVNTRLRKLDEGEFDAIILAAAGLMRLGFEQRIASLLTVEESLPAVGQGAVGVEIRSNDDELDGWLGALHHEPSAVCVRAERAMNRRLEGGCQVPIAGYCIEDPDHPGQLWLRGLVGSEDGSQIIRAEARGAPKLAEQMGVDVAEQLLAAGADKILAELYAKHGAS